MGRVMGWKVYYCLRDPMLISYGNSISVPYLSINRHHYQVTCLTIESPAIIVVITAGSWTHRSLTDWTQTDLVDAGNAGWVR